MIYMFSVKLVILILSCWVGLVVNSDMAAFKAANPGAILEDFVRWQSPQDWSKPADISGVNSVGMKDVAESIGRGNLSEHISKPGSLWSQIWDSVGAHAASEQRSLFDYTREAEKVSSSYLPLHSLYVCP